MSHSHRIFGVAGVVGFLAAITLASACSSSTSRESARSQATTLTCQRYQMCDLIGPGKSYADISSCEIDWQANWEKAWPAADCDGKINQAELETCMAAIRSTNCMGFDFAGTLLKCQKANVCSAGGTPDGG
jgi:hypothetical protein